MSTNNKIRFITFSIVNLEVDNYTRRRYNCCKYSLIKRRSTTYSRNLLIQKRLKLSSKFCTTFWRIFCIVFFLYRIRTKFFSTCTFYNTFSIKNRKRRENHDYYVRHVIETLPMFLIYSKNSPLRLKLRIQRFLYMRFHLRS